MGYLSGQEEETAAIDHFLEHYDSKAASEKSVITCFEYWLSYLRQGISAAQSFVPAKSWKQQKNITRLTLKF